MRSLLLNRLMAIWLLLVGATLLSIEIVNGLIPGSSSHAVAVAVLIVAFVKVRFVGLEFMELRYAPAIARWVFEVWLIVLCFAIIAFYLLNISV
jgi:hypothetical protein